VLGNQLRCPFSSQLSHLFVGIWAGISIANYSDLSTWPVVPEADLQPYIDDSLDLIEFVTGDAKSTKGGQLRARLGRTEPYELKFIEMCVIWHDCDEKIVG
jgi:alpha-L-arabinofuranosidase